MGPRKPDSQESGTLPRRRRQVDRLNSATPRIVALLALVVVAGGCQSTRVIEAPESAVDEEPPFAAQVSIGENLLLSLPASPGYPDNRLLFQTLVGRYEGRTRAFQATLSLSPERAEIVLLAPSGPRVMHLEWTEAGIVETRSRFAPEDLDGLNILADIFISTWPKQAVNAALPENAVLLTGNGDREIWRDDIRILDVEDSGLSKDGRRRARLTHLERGYVLDIISEELERQ